jgi:ribosomal-protein-alanine N-acetyltransferase
MKLPQIETPSTFIQLLPIEQSHLLCEYYQRNKTHLHAWEPHRNDEFYTHEFWQNQVEDSIHMFNKKQAVRLVVLNKEQAQVIAVCNFANIVYGCFQACHLGYSIDKNHQGKGIMCEVLQAGINYMQNEFNLHRIMANHLTNNHRSAKLLKKVGFEKEGYAKDYLKINGRWQDHVLNALILNSTTID